MTEREWDKRLRVRTIGREDEADANHSPYEPTPYCVLERLAESGVIRRRQRVLDYGCGKGRVAVFLAKTVGCGVTGVDKSRKLIDIARENLRASGTGDRVRLVCALAEQHEPGDEDVFFFFNPFSAKVFGGVLRRLVAASQARNAELTVICYYPSEEYIAELEALPDARHAETIDCGDLFNGKNDRERVEVYRLFPIVDRKE